jgi:hypothetical protein
MREGRNVRAIPINVGKHLDLCAIDRPTKELEAARN